MINLWPFDPEEPVELLWIKSPYRDRSKEWMVPLFLRNSGGQTKEFPIPWGLLPNFRLGQHYINGISAETYKTGSITRFDLEDPSSGRLCTIKDLPEGFTVKNYSDIKDECLWMCDVGKTTVYIPCVEVIRSLFAPNAILARAILEPEGLNFVASCKTYVTGMDLIIDQSVPRGLVTEDFILHLAWLHTDPLAKTIWNSILNEIRPSGDVHPDLHLFEGVLNDMEIKPKKIKAKPPLTGKAFMEVRGIQKDYSFLVLEIVAVGNLSLSFKHITYTQNPKVKRRPPDGSRPAVKRIKRKKENQPVSVSDNPSSVSKTTISKNSSNVLLFDKLPEIEKYENIKEEEKDGARKKQDQSNNIGEDNEVGKDREELDQSEKQSSINIQVEKRLFSGAEVLYTGEPEVHPLEFHAPSTLDMEPGYGLKPFLDAIDKLGMLDQRVRIIDRKIDLAPAGKAFSHNEEGGPRKYAFITVMCDREKRYIIEVERLRKTYLSTLIIEPKNNRDFDEPEMYEILWEILVGLVKNYGSWNTNQLENHPKVRINHVKHLEKWSALDWAEVIYNRLEIPVEAI